MSIKTSFKAAVLVAGVILAQTADASHYRGGALVPSVDANGLVTFTTTTFWRRTASTTLPQTFPVSGTTIEGGFTMNGSSIGVSNTTRVIDFSDSRYAQVTETYTVQLQTAGTTEFTWSSCCHVSGITNNTGGSEALTSRITWDGEHANTPILFDLGSVNSEVNRASAYSDNLGAVSGNGGGLAYDTALSESITGQPAPSYSVDAAGNLTITNADTTAMTYDNASNIGADYSFSGNIYNADGSSVEYEWVLDAVDGTAQNLAPTVNNMVINVFVGDVVNATVTGSDPDGDPLTWDLQALLVQPGYNGLFTFDPLTQQILWDTSGTALGSYTALVRASDGLLTETGTVQINVLQRSSAVSEPSILALLGLGLTGLAIARRRKN